MRPLITVMLIRLAVPLAALAVVLLTVRFAIYGLLAGVTLLAITLWLLDWWTGRRAVQAGGMHELSGRLPAAHTRAVSRGGGRRVVHALAPDIAAPAVGILLCVGILAAVLALASR